MKTSKKISGVIVPIITPVDDRDRVDEKSFRAVITNCLNAGVNGIFVGGSAGMGPLLTETQWRRAMEIARDTVGAEFTLMGGIICPSTGQALEHLAFLEKTGFDTFAITPTFYITIEHENQFIKHFETCYNNTDMEMVVYNIPGCTNSNIPLTAVAQMAEKGWFKVMKESSGDKNYFTEIMKIAREHDLTVLQGSEVDIEWGLTIGAQGIVPVCANFEPATFVSTWDAACKKDLARLAQMQQRIHEAKSNVICVSENWVAGIMYAASLLGFGSGKPVAPICEISNEAKAHIEKFMQAKPQSKQKV